MNEKVAILDCGGQYTKVIDRKVREAGVYSDIFALGTDVEKLKGYNAIILSGGPSSVWSAGAPKYDGNIFELGKPILGICYGMQLINEHFGGKVLPEVKTEYGQTIIDVDTSCPLFEGLESKQAVLMSHGDAVKVLADGFECVGKTGDVVAAIYDKKRRIIGVQFHPEVELSEKGPEMRLGEFKNGKVMLENFLRGICGLKEVYALEDRIQTSVDMIRKRVGDKKVMVLVSGGVDSAVTAALLTKALPPENVYAIHIDHGMMRKNESDIICKNLSSLGLVNMKRVNAAKTFFYDTVDDGNGNIIGPLAETCDPEMKRKIIGSMFISLKKGVSRGIFSNEAGLGTGSIAHACSDTDNAVQQGYFGIFEVFMDTIVICTMTALVILCSGVPVNYGQAAGAELTISGFTSTYGSWVSLFTAVAMCCFAFSTIIGWGLYGSRCVEFIFTGKAVRPFLVAYSLVSIVGATIDLGLLWDIADTCNGFMAIPNLIALFLLSGVVVKLVKGEPVPGKI